MPISDERRPWSLITKAQLEAYIKQAGELIEFAGMKKLPAFAAAVAGVAFIRNAVETMGGDLEWWVAFVRLGDLPPVSVATANDTQKKDGT